MPKTVHDDQPSCRSCGTYHCDGYCIERSARWGVPLPPLPFAPAIPLPASLPAYVPVSEHASEHDDLQQLEDHIDEPSGAMAPSPDAADLPAEFDPLVHPDHAGSPFVWIGSVLAFVVVMIVVGALAAWVTLRDMIWGRP